MINTTYSYGTKTIHIDYTDLFILQLLVVILKEGGVLDCSWAVALIPMWVALIITGVVAIYIGICRLIHRRK